MTKPKLIGETVKIELSLTWKIILSILVVVFTSGMGLLTWAYGLADKTVARANGATDSKLSNYVTYKDWVFRIDRQEKREDAWRQELRDRMTRVEDKVNNLVEQEKGR